MRQRFSGPRGRLLLENHAEVMRIVRANCGKKVEVFGSVARGEDHPDSDIDLLVTLEDKATLLDQVGIQLQLEALLGCKVDVHSRGAYTQTVDGPPPHRRLRILREAIPL